MLCILYTIYIYIYILHTLYILYNTYLYNSHQQLQDALDVSLTTQALVHKVHFDIQQVQLQWTPGI